MIAVFDGGCPLTEDDQYLINKINNKKKLAVINKSDVEQLLEISKIKEKFQHIVYISAKENQGVEKLKCEIESIFEINEMTIGTVSASNERQKRCIESSLRCIDSAIDALNSGELLDAVNVIIDEAEQFLLELTGQRITNAVVDEVFSRFCVGK